MQSMFSSDWMIFHEGKKVSLFEDGFTFWASRRKKGFTMPFLACAGGALFKFIFQPISLRSVTQIYKIEIDKSYGLAHKTSYGRPIIWQLYSYGVPKSSMDILMGLPQKCLMGRVKSVLWEGYTISRKIMDIP